MATIDINTAMLLGIAAMNAITTIAAWRMKKDTAEIKVHSNSMKDALVGAKEEVAALRAVEASRVQFEKDAAERAKGALEAQSPAPTTVADVMSKNNGEPAKVEVVNTEKAVPVKITKPAIDTIKHAVEEATRKPKSKPRKRRK